ncbi:MAG: type III pantothenate kinase, partial [Actinomycetota bacterium]
MLLAIDAGNTQTHIGVFSGGGLAAQWRISTRPVRTADELAGSLGNL